MRILFVLPALPFPPSDGGKAKIYNILKYLAPKQCCDLVCFGKFDVNQERQFRSEVPELGCITQVRYPRKSQQLVGACWNLLRLTPPSFARFFSGQMNRILEEIRLSNHYDIIHYDIVNMAQYFSEGGNEISVHSPNDATSHVYRRLAKNSFSRITRFKLTLSSLLLRRFERKVYPLFDKIHVVSPIDKSYLAALAPKSDIEVIPISSGFSYGRCEIQYTDYKKCSDLKIAVCGNLALQAISQGFEDFLTSVVPQLVKAYPSVRVRVLSKYIGKSLRKKISRSPNVEYLSWVEDFGTFLSEAAVVVAPDKAGAPGAKTRVVQAMAMGTVVLGTEAAFEGVPFLDGKHGFTYEGSGDCLHKLLRLLEESELRGLVGKEAAIFAAEEYAIERIGPRYEDMYLRAVSKRRNPQKRWQYS